MAKDLLLELTTTLKDGNKLYKDANIRTAWTKLKAGTKPDPIIRNRIGRIFSDYFSKSGIFINQPNAKGKYENPGSMPDTEVERDNWVEILGPALAAELETGGGTTESRITAELKQKLGAGTSATTITQAEISGQDFEAFKRKFKDLVSRSFTNKEVHDFLETSLPAYRSRVIKIIEQKLRNYLVINYLDRDKQNRPIIGIVPGAAKFLKINTSEGFRKYIKPEMRVRKNKTDVVKKAKKRGQPLTIDMFASFPISFRLTPEADKLLYDKATDISAKVYETLAKDFIPKFIEYAVKQVGSKRASIDALIEILRIAESFNPAKKQDYKIVAEITKLSMGVLTGNARAKASRQLSSGTGIQAVMSQIQLTQAVQKSVRRKMPKGPVGGTPLSDDILTYRSGRFLRSIIVQMRQNIITYFYDPIYTVHEASGRAPSKDIELSIRNVIKRNMGGQEFTITRR